ncbi:hypothetical protein I4641_19755 [Waterburya agarophytonicola K14]|uniref:Uncharacterized protein n=1 Tax=Waterburya agarophytonicola KI4 TaxID=2874699 RepID=A0A964FHN1_9CYAN|nr:hypothetical protein [Waterburya agarophytonicola]MCC0179202.1 hypothetical protein [Waterburya agarophytonicola KI4]
MNSGLSGSDANGYWQWKDAYDVLEIAQIKYLQTLLPKLNHQQTLKLLNNKLPVGRK